jgi:hypothetical protein
MHGRIYGAVFNTVQFGAGVYAARFKKCPFLQGCAIWCGHAGLVYLTPPNLKSLVFLPYAPPYVRPNSGAEGNPDLSGPYVNQDAKWPGIQFSG